MGLTRTLNRSFSGGEISPEMYGRIDDAKYQAGAAKLQNFIATPQGPAENRPGFAYVNSTKNNGIARLIPFTFNSTQTMVVEMGAGYFRFHTNGETLVYSPTGPAWVAPSGGITISYSTPAVVTWTAHGLTTGDAVAFYLYGGAKPSDVPVGLSTGTVYAVQTIDANSFYILQNGALVGIAPPAGTPGSTTTYTGSGTTSASAFAGPGQADTEYSTTLSGFPSIVPASGFATLLVGVQADIELDGSAKGTVELQYSTGAGWNTFYSSSVSSTGAYDLASAQIQVANINLIQFRLKCTASASAGRYYSGSDTNRGILAPVDSVGDSGYVYGGSSGYASGNIIDGWKVIVTTSGALPTTFAGVRAFRQYYAGDVTTFGGNHYIAGSSGAGGLVTPTDDDVWSLLPASLVYEIKNSYTADDLFSIHYVQSADVITLVHPNYPPSELRRLGAQSWTFVPIEFGEIVAIPQQVAATASPGYKAVITAATLANPSVITTAAPHTLSLGDGVYVAGLKATFSGVQQDLSGFYLVSNVPVDGTGAPIPNQLQLMNYDGAVFNLGGGAWSAVDVSAATIQFGGKIFDITNYYVVTALTSDGVNESPVSVEASVLDNLNVPGSFNVITWSAVANAARYRVYKKKNGLYGFIGETTTTTFNDNNIGPDFSITPPIYETVFSKAGDYPSAVSYFDQRRVFAGTTNAPQDVWMSKSGTEHDFSYSLPVKDTDRIYFRVASREANTIQHVIPLTQLLLMTNSAELRVSPVNSDAITPSDISVRPQSYVGASTVQPNIVNNSLVYCSARGGHVREMGYQWAANGFVTGDLSLRAAHLFDNLTILDQCYTKCPRPILWFVSSGGNLIGLTYIPEEQIGAWHHHSTDGYFESITAVAEGAEDRLYAVIRRTVNGQTVRYIERMASRIIDENDSSTWFFVDAGSTYNGVPATTISGLTWLEGKTVSVLADGAKQNDKTVVGGSITLDHSASVVQVGLPYTPEVETLPLILQVDGFGQGRTKNINKVWVRTYQSSGVLAGPDETHLQAYKQRSTEAFGKPPALQTDELEIVIDSSWQQSGQVFIQGTPGLPLTVVGITMQVAVGG